MIIKLPVCYDTSYWETVPDFALIKPRPLLAITKATEGETLKDPRFDQYMSDIQADGIHDGAFHFFRANQSVTKQVQNFVSVVKPHIQPDTILILDIEESVNGKPLATASMMWAWFEAVRSAYPFNPQWLYGREELLNQIPMTDAEAAYFRQIPVWTAGYPYDNVIDSINTVPQAYIPNPAKYGPVWLWQYSDRAVVEGIQGKVDVNWMSPELIQWLGDDVIPAPDEGEKPSMLKGKVIRNVNVRENATTSSADVGDLFVGQIVTASDDAAGWWKILEVDSSTRFYGKWAAQFYNGIKYIEPIIETTPPVSDKPMIHVSLKADGYPDFDYDWQPL